MKTVTVDYAKLKEFISNCSFNCDECPRGQEQESSTCNPTSCSITSIIDAMEVKGKEDTETKYIVIDTEDDCMIHNSCSNLFTMKDIEDLIADGEYSLNDLYIYEAKEVDLGIKVFRK